MEHKESDEPEIQSQSWFEKNRFLFPKESDFLAAGRKLVEEELDDRSTEGSVNLQSNEVQAVANNLSSIEISKETSPKLGVLEYSDDEADSSNVEKTGASASLSISPRATVFSALTSSLEKNSATTSSPPRKLKSDLANNSSDTDDPTPHTAPVGKPVSKHPEKGRSLSFDAIERESEIDRRITMQVESDRRKKKKFVHFAHGTADPSPPVVAVGIIKHEYIEAGGYTEYTLQVWQSDRSWTVKKRYRQFSMLHSELAVEFEKLLSTGAISRDFLDRKPNTDGYRYSLSAAEAVMLSNATPLALPDLPKKRWFEAQRWLNRHDPMYELLRKQQLQEYIRAVVKIPGMTTKSSVLQKFLELDETNDNVRYESFVS